jgi:hypothetical protein
VQTVPVAMVKVGAEIRDLIPFMRTQIEGLKAKGKIGATSIQQVPECFDIERFFEAVASLCRVEAEYLHPELKDAFRGSELIQKRCLAAVEGIKKVIDSGPASLRGMVESGEAVAWINSVFEHFEYLEREFLPKVRQHVGTEQREELVQIMLDALQQTEGRLSAVARRGQAAAGGSIASVRA